MVFFLIIYNIIYDYFFNKKPNAKVSEQVPEFYSLKNIQPQFFALSVLIISVAGLFNVWYYCSMLLQRFSVPELSKNKVIVHFMFIFGSFSNFIFIFFGLSPAIVGIKTMKLTFIELNLTMTIFLVFIICNIFFAILAWYAIEKIRGQSPQAKENLRNSVRMKLYVVTLAVISLGFYIFAMISYNNYKLNGYKDESLKQYYIMLRLVIFLLPYFLYIINAFLNLTYYSDILKIQAHLNVFLENEYFIVSSSERQC
jgi:hypothetical protein